MQLKYETLMTIFRFVIMQDYRFDVFIEQGSLDKIGMVTISTICKNVMLSMYQCFDSPGKPSSIAKPIRQKKFVKALVTNFRII